AVDDQVVASTDWQAADPALVSARRQYVTAVVRRRLHQRGFRERVLRAYQMCCAICRLRHDELLEAAHILPDGHPRGEPVIPNGLALCKLHHAAFDSYIIGVTPDLEVKVRLDVLEEIDGRAPTTSSRIATSWRSAMNCSGERVEPSMFSSDVALSGHLAAIV